MATLTVQISVCPVEFEVGLLVMIENPHCPTVRVVALRTFGTQRGLVIIVILVAGNTLGFGILKGRGKVTFFARCRGMQSQQGEACEAVVERDSL